MNVALVVHDFDAGYGQGRYCVELARRLAADHQIFVLANTFAPDLEPNWTYQRVPAIRRNSILTIISFARSAEKFLRRRKFDIIHAQGFACWTADVVTAHICNKARKQRLGSLPLRSRPFYQLIPALEQRFYRSTPAGRVAAVSRLVAAEIRDCYGWNKPIETIYHGVDALRFHPPSSAERAAARKLFGAAETERVWMFAGEAAKGLSAVIEELPHFPSVILLAVSRSDLRSCRELGARLGVEKRLRLLGPREDLAAAYHCADVFVYPTDYDAFGLVVAEAMASGLPVVTGEKAGAAEWIVNGENGLTIRPEMENSLRSALEWIEGHAKDAREMGARGRTAALQHTWDQCAREVLALYQQELAAKENR